MSHHTTLKEGKRPNSLCSINDLVWHHKVPRSNLFLQTSDRAERNDCPYTNGPQSGDIGADGNLVWCELMVEAVTREESNRYGLAGGRRRVV